ncbi:MAG: histidine kinase [Acidobacteria bacterium]|nr:histidine kinase [Acidobacteriota bacterium]
MKDQLDSLINQMIEKDIYFEEALSEFQRRFIKKVLEKSNGNLSKAAKTLGIHRNTLSRKIVTLGLDDSPNRRVRAHQYVKS